MFHTADFVLTHLSPEPGAVVSLLFRSPEVGLAVLCPLDRVGFALRKEAGEGKLQQNSDE